MSIIDETLHKLSEKNAGVKTVIFSGKKSYSEPIKFGGRRRLSFIVILLLCLTAVLTQRFNQDKSDFSAIAATNSQVSDTSMFKPVAQPPVKQSDVPSVIASAVIAIHTGTEKGPRLPIGHRTRASAPVRTSTALPVQGIREYPPGGNNDWEHRTALVREQLNADNYMEAVKNAQMLTVDFPDRWEPWFWAGTAQLALGQLEAASSSLEHANKLNPGVAQIKIQRAIVAQEKGDHLTAIALLNKAGVLSPDSAQIFLNLGYSHDALGMTSEANKDYQRYLVLTEGDNRYEQQRLSILQRMQGKP